MGLFSRGADKPKVIARYGFTLFLFEDGRVERSAGEGAGVYSVEGVTARVEAGEALQRRVTATRLAAMGVFALAAKKETGGTSYLTIEGPEFFWTVEVERKDAQKARDFANAVNLAARKVNA